MKYRIMLLLLLLFLPQATKEKREKSDGSGTSPASPDKHKAGDDEERENEKQARISQMESLMKELEGLLKQDGLSFMSPVIGFYCQKCEEFIGDLNSAEKHAAIHRHSNSSSKGLKDKPAGDGKGHSRQFSNSTQHPPPSDRTGDHRNHRDPQRDWRDDRDLRSKRRHHGDVRAHRAGQDGVSLKEEMRKERMLITVSRGLTPPPGGRVKEEASEEQTAEGHGKVKVEDKGKSSKGNRAKDGSSDSSSSDDDNNNNNNNKGKQQKTKSPKKKKKKKEKKKKKKKS